MGFSFASLQFCFLLAMALHNIKPGHGHFGMGWGGPPPPPMGAPPPPPHPPPPSSTTPPPPSSRPPPGMFLPPYACLQPPNTSMLIYNKQEPNIKTLDNPVAECQCTPELEIAYFASETSDIPTTGGNAGQSTLNMQCQKPEDFCICDEQDQCWRLENAKAQVVLNSYCEGGACHLFARMNNIKPFTQALVNAVTGKKLTLQDQLESVDGNPKIHQYRTMKGNPDYYVKAKSITCAGAGQCKPVKCAMEVPSSTPMPPPIMISPPVSPPPINVIPVVYEGEVCACKMMAELVGKMNLLVEKQISAINSKSAKVTINAAALFSMKVEAQGTTIVVKGDLEADPTMFDQISADLKLKLNVNVKKILASIRSSDLKGLADIFFSGSVKSLTELKVQLQQKCSGITTLVHSLSTKFMLSMDEGKKQLEDPAVKFLEESKSLLVDGAKDVIKLVGDNLAQQPGLGDSLVSSFLSVFFSLDLSLNLPPPPPSSSPPPPIILPITNDLLPIPMVLPPIPSSSPPPPIGAFQMEANFSFSMSLILKDAMKKVEECKDDPDTLIKPIKMDPNAELKVMAQKCKEQLPITSLELLSKIKPSDLEGLKDIFFQMTVDVSVGLPYGASSPAPPLSPPLPLLADALPLPFPPLPLAPSSSPPPPPPSSSTPPPPLPSSSSPPPPLPSSSSPPPPLPSSSSPPPPLPSSSSPPPPPAFSGQISIDIAAEFKQKCPGINAALAAFLVKTDMYVKQFGNQATAKIGKQIFSLSVSLKAKLKAQLDADPQALEEIKDILKAKYPDMAKIGKVDIKGAFSAIIMANMQMLSDQTKKQQVLADLKVDDPSLSDLAASLNDKLSVNAKTVLALMKPKDMDGFKLVIDLSAQGQISSVRELIKAMQDKCPGLLEALRILAKNLLVLGESIYDKLSSKAKELIKKILKVLKDFFKFDLKMALKQLENDVPGLLGKLFADLISALPSLKPLIIGLKFSLDINVDIKVNGQQIQYPPSSTPTPPPPPPPPPSTSTPLPTTSMELFSLGA